MVDLITEHIATWTGAEIPKANGGRGRGRGANGQSPHGIKKLRELILELAVRGKLVLQDPNDEPASVLLEKIAKEKARLIREGKIKKQSLLPEIPEDEKLYELPVGWVWTRLGTITQINPRNDAEDELSVSFVPMPLITTSHSGEHGQETKTWGEIKKSYTHFADGDIGVAKITPCFENSKAVVFSELENGIGAGTTELHIARPFSATLLAPRYILLFLKAPMFLIVGETKMTGTAGQKRVPKEFFSERPLPLPPFAEQHRIVAKVDELMALCDKLEQQQTNSNETHQTLVKTLLATLTTVVDPAEFALSWQRIAAHFDTLFTTEESIDQLKQTILQLAVMGKLVPQDPNDEPASTLLEKIAKEKARLIKEGKIKKQKPLPKISEDEKPFELPDGWEWGRLGDIATFENGDRSKRYPNSSDHQLSGVPFFGASDMVDGVLSFQNGLRFISLEKFSELSNGKLVDKDFVILLRGTVGKMAIFNATEEFSTGFINAQMLIVRVLKPDFCDFFGLYRKSNFFLSFVADKTTGTAVRQMPASVVLNFLVPLPPLAEQYRIVAKVDELMTLCDTLKERLHDAQIIQVQLADAIVEQVVA
jgi:type I restriction enzyme, S subunit